MEILYFLILTATVLILAYNRVSLVMSMAIMIALTIGWTELRHFVLRAQLVPFANGIVAVT